MAGACPIPGPEAPMVRALLGSVDCNVRDLVHSGYASLFQANGALASVLTVLLTLYVAFIGYRLMLGRGAISVGDFALTAVKLGAVLALATQWDTYQAVVFNLLFRGPEQLASTLLVAIRTDGVAMHGDVLDGLQATFDDLTRFSASYASHSPIQTSPLLGGIGFGAFALTSSAVLLLLASLGVLLATKIVLGLLLALGPVFIALFLFDSTRGVFEGWLRASLAFAFAPLAATVLLSVELTLLNPPLAQIELLQRQSLYTLGPVYAVATLVLVFVGVIPGAMIAGGMIARGLKLPWPYRLQAAADRSRTVQPAQTTVVDLPRAARVAAAATALDRRDGRIVSTASVERASERRFDPVVVERGGAIANVPVVRLGERRRIGQPLSPRTNARTAR